MHVDVSLCGFMKQYLLSALVALLSFFNARAQLDFSDSLRVSLLTCSAGPDAYERFGHSGIRILDLKDPTRDITFHYGVFSFNAPNFVYRFVKGETDYQLGAQYTSDFVAGYRHRGLGMTEQWLHLDSAQCQDIVKRLLINYRPENRTYRYSFFFDNCATRPYHLFNASTGNTIQYDSTWVKALTLREMVQEKSGTDNWLDFGIALAVALRADRPASYEEQMFLPEYLSGAFEHAAVPMTGIDDWTMPLVCESDTLLTMRSDVAEAIAAPDPIRPVSVFAFVLMLAMVVSALEWRARHQPDGVRWIENTANSFDTVYLLFIGLTGVVVWFLNFCSLHPAVDHNLNCLWLLPTHVIMAVMVWMRSLRRINSIYFGIVFALVILYVVLDWCYGQYCPAPFLLLLATLLLRSYMRCTQPKTNQQH